MQKKNVVPVLTFALGLLGGGALTAAAVGPASTGQEGPVTGIGGVFFKAEDPEALRAWYREHLGIDAGPQGADFSWRETGDPESLGRTVWSIFPADTDYFGRGDQQLMINYRVRDLDGLLDRLRAEGVIQAGETEEYPYGRFAWILDGEGNRVELWEPPQRRPDGELSPGS